MSSLAEFLGYLAILGGLSLALAWVITELRQRSQGEQIPEGATLRLRTSGGVFRSTLQRSTRHGMIISAPISRDHYVPFRVGEMLQVEAITARGVSFFQTAVLDRIEETKEFLIRKPLSLKLTERREEPRPQIGQLKGKLEGEEARILDISSKGARVATRASVARGERVRIDVNGLEQPLFGWVLEVVPGGDLGYNSYQVRLRFEEVFDTEPIQKMA